MRNYNKNCVMAGFLFLCLMLPLVIGVYVSIDELHIEGRKLFALILGIPFLVLINLFFVTSIEKCILVILVFYPIWQRPAYYIKLMSFSDGFYTLSFQQIYLVILSIVLILSYIGRDNKEVKPKELLCIFFSLIILISSTVNYIYTDQNASEYNFNLLIVNYYIPSLLFIGLVLYVSSINSTDYLNFIIRCFLIFQILFCFVELISRGGSILSNPSLLLTYGLRVPSGSDGSQIITGGIRDLLYFAWLFSWMPIYFHYRYKNKYLTRKEYMFWMVFSYLIVMLTYSKSPIVILLMNTLIILKVDGLIRKATLMKVGVLGVVLLFVSPFIINNFISRVMQFADSVTAFFTLSDSASRSIDMTVYFRLKSIMEQIHFVTSDSYHFFFGGFSNFVEGSSLFLVPSVFGMLAFLLISIISILYFIKCNIYQKGVFLSFLLYSITSLESFVGVSNYKIFMQSVSFSEYIQNNGWYPQYSMGNVFVTIILFVFVQKTLEDKNIYDG